METTYYSPTPCQNTRRLRRTRGSVLVMSLLMLFITLLLGMGFLTLAQASNRLANRGAHKVQAAALAEAAVQKHYDTIRNYLSKNQAWSDAALGALGQTALISNDGASRNDGTYWSQATVLNTVKSDDTLNNRQITTYTIQVAGTGKAINGTKSVSYATFTVTQTAPYGGLSLALAFDATAVLQSNSTVSLATNTGFRTHSSGNGYDGSIIANNGIIWKPASGNKGTNPNTLMIDGQVFAGDQTTTDMTASPNGIGNSNGTKNYQTNASPERNGHPVASQNAITNLGAPKVFPDAVTVALWKTTWITAVTLGTHLLGPVTILTTPLVNGERRITAPAYIHGDLNIASGQLYLQPNSNPSKSNIIYVEGNINNGALIYNRGVLLVCTGKYKATNTSAQYALQTQNSPYNLYQLFSKTALVSLATASDAIDMGSNVSSNTGLVYAALGGIVCKANNNFYGVLVAGGVGNKGGIVAGGENSFDITFTPHALEARTEFDFSLTIGNGKVGQIDGTTVTNLSQFF